MNDTILTWDALEYHHIDKTSDWYWSLGIISFSIVLLAILFNNLLFALFVLLAAVTLGMYGGRPPEIVRIELRKKGILMADRLYDYDSLESFWIEEEDVHPKILVKSQKILMPYIIIPLGDVPHEVIREELLKYMPEVEHHESVGHKLLEYFGF